MIEGKWYSSMIRLITYQTVGVNDQVVYLINYPQTYVELGN